MGVKTAPTPNFIPDPHGPYWSRTDGYVHEDPSELVLPQDILDRPDALVHKISGEIAVEFDGFWSNMLSEAEANGGMYVANRHSMTDAERERTAAMTVEHRKHILDESDRRNAFRREIRWADLMLTNAFALDKEFPERYLVFDFDVDDVIGKQQDQPSQLWLSHLPELQGVNLEVPAPEHADLVRQITLREQAKRMIFRPALGPVTRFIYDELYTFENRIRFGLSSSHSQEEMRKYLAPRLKAECTGFKEYEMMDSAHGAIARTVRTEVMAHLTELQMKAAETGGEVPESLTYADMLRVYPELDGLFDLTDASTLTELENGQLDRQGIKPLMAAQRYREIVGEGRSVHGDTVIVQVDDWPLFRVAANRSEHVRLWHMGRELRFILPDQKSYTNPDDIGALLLELGMEARHN